MSVTCGRMVPVAEFNLELVAFDFWAPAKWSAQASDHTCCLLIGAALSGCIFGRLIGKAPTGTTVA